MATQYELQEVKHKLHLLEHKIEDLQKEMENVTEAIRETTNDTNAKISRIGAVGGALVTLVVFLPRLTNFITGG